MKNLKEVIIVTGGGSGIGKAIAMMFLRKNKNVVIIGKNEKKLKDACSDLALISNNVSYMVGDVRNSELIKKNFLYIYKKFGRIDVLINNAGFSSGKSFELVSIDNWTNEIQTNLFGTFICSKHVYSYMKRSGKGIIINIASDRGQKGSQDSSVGYAASKAGIINLTKSLAMQLAKYDIRVNCVSPAAIDKTGISNNWSKELKKKIKSNISLKRLGVPEEIATVVYFLSTDESSFITGATIDVNGGLLN